MAEGPQMFFIWQYDVNVDGFKVRGGFSLRYEADKFAASLNQNPKPAIIEQTFDQMLDMALLGHLGKQDKVRLGLEAKKIYSRISSEPSL